METIELLSGVLFLIALTASLIVTMTRMRPWLIKLAYLCLQGAILLQIGLVTGEFSSVPVHKQIWVIVGGAGMIVMAILMHQLTRTVLTAERKRRSHERRLPPNRPTSGTPMETW